MLSFGGSPSGEETVQCAPPTWPNDERQLVKHTDDAAAGGMEGKVDDNYGSFKDQLTIPPPFARGDIPHNHSELLRHQLALHPLPRPTATAP